MRTVALGDLASVERVGVNPARLDPATAYLGLEHIEPGGRILGRDTIGGARPTSTKFAFTPDHVLYGRLRPNLGKICRPPFAGVCSTDILPIRPGPELDRDYLRHFLSQPAMLALAASRTTGASLPRLSPAVLDTFEVPLPPLDQQRWIATLLDRAQGLRDKRRLALADIDLLDRAAFGEMFGAEPTRGVVADLATFVRTGPSGNRLRHSEFHSEFIDDGVAVLGLDNVVGNEFRWARRRSITPEKHATLARYTVHPGDVLISIMDTTGRCVVVPDDIPTAITTKHICAITVDRDRLDPSFLRAAFLWHPAPRAHLRRRTRTSTVDGLNLGVIRVMPVPVPVLDRQREFAAWAGRVDRYRARTRRALAADDELFAALRSRAFRGEL